MTPPLPPSKASLVERLWAKAERYADQRFDDWNESTATLLREAAAHLSEGARLDLATVLTELVKQSESFVKLANCRGEDLRQEASRQLRNAIASAKAALSQPPGSPAATPAKEKS